MSIRFIALVDGRYKPLYFRSAPNTPREVAVNQQLIAEMSLDFVEQQMPQLQAQLHSSQLMLSHDGIAVYARLTNTRITYLVGISSNTEPTDIDGVFNEIIDAYTAYQCSPFAPKAGTIKSPNFDTKIETIMGF